MLGILTYQFEKRHLIWFFDFFFLFLSFLLLFSFSDEIKIGKGLPNQPKKFMEIWPI